MFGKEKTRVPASCLLQKIADDDIISEGKRLVAYFTDHADFITDLDNCDVSGLLELRIFDSASEFRAYRFTVNEDFVCRLYKDSEFNADEMLYEIHYLDIDSTQEISECSNGMYKYKTMNGGTYHLPVDNAERIRICNYLMYNDEGIAQVYDYRFVEIISKGGAENGQ